MSVPRTTKRSALRKTTVQAPSDGILSSTKPVLGFYSPTRVVEVLSIAGVVYGYASIHPLSRHDMEFVQSIAPKSFKAFPAVAKRWGKWMVYADPDWVGMTKHQAAPVGQQIAIL